MKFANLITQEVQRIYGNETEDITYLRFFANLSYGFAMCAESGTPISEQTVRELIVGSEQAEKRLKAEHGV